jgi:hypothetical protein
MEHNDSGHLFEWSDLRSNELRSLAMRNHEEIGKLHRGPNPPWEGFIALGIDVFKD